MVRSKRDMMLWMPITSKGHNLESLSKLVDDRNDALSTLDIETSARQEAILDIYNQKSLFMTLQSTDDMANRNRQGKEKKLGSATILLHFVALFPAAGDHCATPLFFLPRVFQVFFGGLPEIY